MADQPEVIQHELDETRHALAEKLGAIGEKISGTVETVTDTVESVTETVENTVEAVTGTVEAVGETAQETVEAVKHAFNIPERVQAHPWLWFGGSVVAGFLGGKLIPLPGASREREREREPAQPSYGNGYSGRHAAEFFGEPGYREAAYAPEARTDFDGHNGSNGNGTAAAPKQSWLSKLADQFGSELNQLKGLALGTLFGLARDMVTHSAPPSLKTQLVDVFNNITQTAGGKPIPGEVMPGTGDESATMKGERHAESDTAEMGRPVGSAEEQGKASVGRPHRR
jgi:ElaB/YqjD/DUF883 family membrane-anchored ribosome-binding protein